MSSGIFVEHAMRSGITVVCENYAKFSQLSFKNNKKLQHFHKTLACAIFEKNKISCEHDISKGLARKGTTRDLNPGPTEAPGNTRGALTAELPSPGSNAPKLHFIS